MSILRRQTRSPTAFDPQLGLDVVTGMAGLDRGYYGLIRGVAGCSPFLAGLLRKETTWLLPALETPEDAMDKLRHDLADVALSALPDALRQAKRRAALLIALADLAGAWPLEVVTGQLTDFANTCVDTSLRALIRAEVARGKIPGMTSDDAETCCGMVALAMGKQGAGELNYSSDIDLICLFDETRFAPDAYHDARAAFIRVTRRMATMMSDVTAQGYVFRTDLRLRPDPSVTPVCLSMEAAERYYESVGRTWERAAYIKAHPAAGDRAAGARFLNTLRPFVWRRHLDFAAIQDAHDMRLRIRDHKRLGGKITLEGHNMKLGRGGIREIEFFTQTRQLIAGGRDSSLRSRRTDAGLRALTTAGWVAPDTAQKLYAHYAAHREVEHRLQMINDAQTHDLPSSDAGFDRLACFMGVATLELRRDLRARLDEVHDLTEGFFAPDVPAPVPDDLDWASEITARWPSYPALRSERATEIFQRLRPEILTRLQDAAKPQEALREFDMFLKGLPAGVQLFSLFEANPQLTQLIVDIAATAPALAQYLSRNAAVFDAVIGGSFFDSWPDDDALLAALNVVLDRQADYEAQLLAARRWTKEWHFRIGVHHLRGLIDGPESGRQYAALAVTVIRGLWPRVIAEFARKHGDAPGDGAVVLGMGSLGAGQLNAASDLDLIVIYDANGVETSDGPRPLATRPYYARLTQAMVTALSAQMAEGRLYEVDMRLRPSGRSGPVATAFEAFVTYQTHEAWTWEHLALTRAQIVTGADGLAARVATFRAKLLADQARSQAQTTLADVAEMRNRIAAAKPPQGAWDAKIGPGRLQDCELFAQTAALCAGSAARNTKAQLQDGVAAGWLNAADAVDISAATGLFWRMQAAARLLTGGVLSPDALGEGGRRFVLRETGCDTMDELMTLMTDRALRADRVISGVLGQAKNDS